MKRVLSLGAGVQSTAVLLMAECGEIEPVDAAIFADTGWEPGAVYEHLVWLEEHCKTPIHRVSKGNIKNDALISEVRGTKAVGRRWVSMPYRTVNPKTGKIGMIRRQCTGEYKITPIHRKLREMVGLKPRQRGPKEVVVEQVYGISFDELTRMRTSAHSWIRNVYPLVEMRMTRQDCIDWLDSRGYPRPARSACVACPFHTNVEWREIRRVPKEWEEAVSFDRAIRNCGGMESEMFVHQSGKPLEDVDLDTMEDKGQLNFWENECHGMCGV